MKKIPFAKYICTIALILLFAPLHSHALVITSPSNGATFKEGDSVKLVAELSPGQTEIIVSVSFVVSGLAEVCPDEIKTHPKYECRFTLPAGSPRTISIKAYAVTFSGPIYSQEVKIIVGLPSSIVLQGLKSFTGNRLFFSKIGQNDQLYIQGIYSDSVERDLRLGQTGTIYVSNNEKVATVSADGLATAVGPGKAQITVRNGDKKLVIDVVVQPKR